MFEVRRAGAGHSRVVTSRKRLRSSVLAVALMVAAGTASAGTLTGRMVTEETQGHLRGGTITIVELDRQAITDRDGRFQFHGIPSGTYTLEARYTGYETRRSTVQVQEGQVVRTDLALAPVYTEMDSVVVVGERIIQSRSLQQKRAAENIVEVATSDGIQALPDGNPAEALRRLPGVFAHDDQGEGRYASIRGIDPELMNVTFNGQAIGSPEGGGSGGSAGRAVRMDSIPAELVSRIEVVKAVTPDMNHNAIGGAINISTASAFDREGTFHSGRVAVGRNDSSGGDAWSGSGTYGTKFGADDSFGLLLSGSYEQREIASQRMSSDAWTPVDDLLLPSELSMFDYLVDRRRWGAALALEHRPDVNHAIKFNASYNRHSDDEDRRLTRFNFRRGTASEQTDLTGRYSQGRVTREYRWYLQEDTIATASLEGEHYFGVNLFDWSVGYSLAEKDTPRRVDWEFRSGGGAFPNSYDLSPPLYSVVADDMDAYMDPGNYPFRRLRRRTDIESDKVWSAQANLRRDIEIGDYGAYWKTGVSALLRDKSQDRYNQNYLPEMDFTLGDFDLAGPDIDGYFDGRYAFGPTLNLQNLEGFFRSHPEYFADNVENSILNSTTGDYKGGEDVYAAYGMLSVSMGDLNVLGGVRMEHTRASYSGTEVFYEDGNFDGQPRPMHESTSYTNFFPGLHLRWDATDKLLVRGSWTNTIGRQPFGSLSPARTFEVYQDEDDGRLTGSISEGNPELDPYEASNFDLSFEYYPSAGGILSATLFHKEIDNAIYTRRLEEESIDFDGYAFDRLTFSRPENAEAGRIQGIEFNAQRFFDFLPAPFDGFGASVNYTYADSTLRVDTRPGEELPYLKQPRHIGNVALMYEKHGWAARVAMAYAGDYLRSVSGRPETDSYRYRRRPIDARISYQATPRLNVFLNVRNINDAADINYSGHPDRRTAHETYDWSAWLGVSWQL